MRKKTLKQRVMQRIQRSNKSVFVRKDFEDIGGYDQVGRILRNMVQEDGLLNMGYGVYARTKTSKASGKTIPEKPLPELAREAMNKLGVEIIPTQAETAYNSGQSTQVPTGRVIGVNKRISRKLGYNGKYISFEKVI